ncbi:MAG TPA: hypothetical protein VK497_04780 [Candidatus Saccharimonadales bacterium]|nr:hypothetical protein [Candidatus Saccharimonadales bacterium]
MFITELQPSPLETSFERLVRTDHAPVPLDPWNVMHPVIDGTSYILASADRISGQLRDVMEGDIAWWVESPRKAAFLYDFMEASLFDAQMMRIHRNAIRQPVGKELLDDDTLEPIDLSTASAGVTDLLNLDDPLVKRAMEGLANADELLMLLEAYPELVSTELAKQSHPLDFTGTRKMQKVIDDLVKSRSGLRIESRPRFKMKSFDPDNLAMTAVRKQIIASVPTKAGPVLFIRRESFIIRGDEEVGGDDTYLVRKVRNPERHDELWEKADGYLSYVSRDQRLRYVDLHPQVKWIQPLTTSVYARYPKDKFELISSLL